MKLEKMTTSTQAKTPKEISVPKSFYAGKILDKEIELNQAYYNNDIGTILMDSVQKQHPLINTWLVLSSISICFLSALFFIIP